MRNALFFFIITLIPIGIILRTFDFFMSNILISLGFLGVLIFQIRQVVKSLQNKYSVKIIVLNILIILMTLSLFSKYLFHSIGDYPALVIVPVFIITSIIYLLTEKAKQTKLSIVTVLYLILTLPLFAFEFNEAPRHYIQQSWHNRYGETLSYYKTIPFSFELEETKLLGKKGNAYLKQNNYPAAIDMFEQGKKLEPKNLYLLFNLSEAYARINQLERAVALLDTAITIDPNYPEFYNNRGLLHYKLSHDSEAISDLKEGIKLDSALPSLYANLAMVYYYQDSFDIACENIKTAESYGLEIENTKHLQKIKAKHCE